MVWNRPGLAAAAIACFACGGTGSGTDVWSPPDGLAGEDATACSGDARVRIVALDAFGRRLSTWEVVLEAGGAVLETARGSDPLVPAPPGAPLRASVKADGFLPAEVEVRVDPGVAEGASARVVGGPAWVALSRAPDGGCRLTCYVGLDHAWFASSGRPFRDGNQVDLLMDGEAFWTAVRDDLVAAMARPPAPSRPLATSDIRMSTWWWQSDFELVRPPGHETMTPGERRANTILSILDSSSAFKRLLVNRFAPETATGMAYLNTDPDIRARGLAGGDGFEVILQGNATEVPLAGTYDGPVPTWSFAERVARNPEFAGEDWPGLARGAEVLTTLDAASYHQKAFVVDRRVAYVSGMNVKSTDWDTSDHLVFDSRRMKFDTSVAERLRVKDKRQLPDLGPRKDYGIRVEGPAAADVDDVLWVRWDLALAEGAMYAEHATPFPRPSPPGSWNWSVPVGRPLVQVVATLPPPIEEQSILETWAKALRNAASYIYIEDQYWRMPILNSVILQTLRERPWVTLIVVTKPVSLPDGAKKWTVETDRAFREAVGDRYLLLQLKSFDAVPRGPPTLPRPPPGGEPVDPDDETATFYFVDMDVHSKVLIVDDEYLSVGSCNKNNRGLLYEGELNVSVWDPEWAHEARRRIYRNLVGPARASEVGDDPAANFALLEDVAERNASVEAWWHANGAGLDAQGVAEAAQAYRPDGFVYPLSFTPEYVIEVGPDVF